MGFGAWWDEAVVPRIIKLGCGAENIMDMRREVVPLARGSVFELGCGGGINQQLYDPQRVTSYTGIDPSPKGLDYAREAARQKGWAADLRQGSGELLTFADASFDTVVCTFTMCSVADQARSLAELRRVLRPGGTFIYAEHGRAPEVAIARLQERVDPLWSKIFGNCHLSREVTPAIERAGFVATPMGQAYMAKGPRFAGWMEWGTAAKPAS